MTDTQTPDRHTFIEKLLGRHDWHPVSGTRFLDTTIFKDECSVCGARRERWHNWKDGELSAEDKEATR